MNFIVLATNAYYDLGVRLRDRLREHYRGNFRLHFFSERDPGGVVWYPRFHSGWLAAVNDKYACIGAADIHPDEYAFFIDADTNLTKDIDVRDIEGELVAAQHFGDTTWMGKDKNFDRHATSTCFVPYDTPHPKMWFMGAFWGGRYSRVKKIARELAVATKTNRDNFHEPGVNDESYLNWYLHYNPPSRVLRWPEQFPFVVSDKGGADNLRDVPYSGGLQ